MEVKGFHKSGRVAEFLAVGTAIRHRGGEPHRSVDGRPFTSDLSGQDFWTLLRTGSRPVGLVLGCSVYSVASTRTASNVAWPNLELEAFTQALYDARELAMARMQTEAKALEANGIVGVQLQENHHGWGGRAIEFLAIGTAIIRQPGQDRPTPPTTVLHLNDAA